MGKEITAKNFKTKLQKAGGQIDEDLKVKDEVVIADGELKVKSFDIRGVEFMGGLVFDMVSDLGFGVKLERCKGNHVILIGSSTNGYNREFDFNRLGGLILERSDFKRIWIDHGCQLDRGIDIREECKMEILDIKNSSFKEGGIYVDNSEIKRLLDVHNVRECGAVDFHKCEIGAKVRLFNVKAGSFSMSGTTLTKDSHFDYCTFSTFTFNESKIADEVSINACSIGSLNTWNDIFDRKLVLNLEHDVKKGKLDKVYIQGSKVGQGWVFNGASSTINQIHILCDDSLAGFFHFNSFAKVGELNVSGTNRSSEIAFNLCEFVNIKLHNFINYSSVRFTQCDSLPGGFLQINNSWLGRTALFNSKFQSFDKIEVYDSQISELDVIGGDWFDDHQFFSGEKEKVPMGKEITKKGTQKAFFRVFKKQSNAAIESLANRKRDIYRQLKISAERNGDRIKAIEYKSAELKNYQDEIAHSKNWWNRESITLWLSSTNDMGLNWPKPLWQLVKITLLFFFPAVICLSDQLEITNIRYINFEVICSSLLVYLNHAFVFVELLNPTRLWSRTFETIDSKWIYLWDGFHKVILAFYIFQIVSAFRKYIR